MGCVGACIAAAASVRPSARTSRVQVRVGLHLRLSARKPHANVGWWSTHCNGIVFETYSYILGSPPRVVVWVLTAEYKSTCTFQVRTMWGV